LTKDSKITHRKVLKWLLYEKTKEDEDMQNVEWEVKGDKLIIEIDLTKDFGPSKSGKTITIASTRGNQKVEGSDAIIGLNVYKYPKRA